MSVPVKVPSAGESVHEGMIETWHKKDGDYVEQDDLLLEIETDKSTQEIFAETSGQLKILKKEGEVVKVGETIADLDAAARPATKNAPPTPQATTSVPSAIPKAPIQTNTGLNNGPAVNHMAKEHNVDVSRVTASGRGGRVTKEDMVKHLSTPAPQVAPKKETPAAPKLDMPVPNAVISEGREKTKEPLSMLRRRAAERLLSAQQNAAILTTFNEVDLSQVFELRKKYQDSFQKEIPGQTWLYGTQSQYLCFATVPKSKRLYRR